MLLCLLHGATFLALQTDGVVRERAHALAGRLGWPAAGRSWPCSPCGPSRSPTAASGGAAAAAVPVVAALAAALLLRAGHEGRSFAATAVAIGGTVAALFANLYPYVMVSSTRPANNLTVVRHRLQRLRPEGHDRRRRGVHPAGPALPGLVLLGLPRPGQREPRRRRGRLVISSAWLGRPSPSVIVGGGFGGLFAAKFLRRAAVDITVGRAHNHHLFQPLLLQVAIGILSPGAVAAPLREVLKRHDNVTVELGEVTGFDLGARTVDFKGICVGSSAG